MPASILPAKDKFIALGTTHLAAIEAYIALLKLKNYSNSTITTYRHWFIIFLCHFPNHKPSTITKYEVMDFLLAYRNSEKWSTTNQNQFVSAIKFFFEELLKRPKEYYDLPRAQKLEQLPSVFAEQEIKQLINVTENLKHRSMLCLAYAGGLRVSEIVNLKIAEIDSKRMVITLRQAKGRKDRQVMLSEKLLQLLRQYFKEYKPKTWLFEGQSGGQYSTRGVQEVIKQAKEKAGIKKKGSIHALWHSFATHLLDKGTDVTMIMKLLGHNSIRTTLRYLHVTNRDMLQVMSPLDDLLLE